MKKVLSFVTLLTLSAGTAFAATSIVNSKHNLSLSGTGVRSSTQTQICIFCHTPHNATRNVPLWNRLDPTTTPSNYKLYTSSNTLTNATKQAKLDSNSYSIFCLSCHDGTLSDIGARVVRNGGNAMTMIDSWGTWGTSGLTQDGKGLTNDHPIGFDYVAAQGANSTYLRTKANVNTALGAGAGTVFYKSVANGSSDSMECSSCHVVHDNTNSPFLRTTNAGSALCLACHIK